MGRQALLDSCTALVNIGNGIALRVVEYLHTARKPEHSITELSLVFLDVSRSLYSARADLTAAANASAILPVDVTQGCQEQFRLVKTIFAQFDHMLTKFLSVEKKRFGKLSKGFQVMLSEGEVIKLKATFNQCRASLSIIVLMLSSTYCGSGPGASDCDFGVGYTALTAVLSSTDPAQDKTSHSLSPKTDQLTALPSPRGPLPPVPSSAAPTENLLHTNSIPRRSPISPTAATFEQAQLSPMRRVSRTLSNTSTPTNSTVGRHVISEETLVDSADQRPEKPVVQGGLRTVASDQLIRVVQINPKRAAKLAPKRNTGLLNAASLEALRHAVHQKDCLMVEQLLDQGVSVEEYMEENLLRMAVINRDGETLRLLLDFGADANGKDMEGYTPLYSATTTSYWEAAKLLLQYGADPNTAAGPGCENPFTISLTIGDPRFAQAFLQHGAQVNTALANGETPFIQAMNHFTPVNLVELMLVHGANPNGKNDRGETALFKAINVERRDLVLCLLDHGADPNLPGPKIVLWNAVHHPYILETLLEHGADLKRAPGVLELATSINSMAAVKILLQHGADPNAKKDGIYTPLCSAIRDDHEGLVATLLDAGADPNLPALDYPVFKAITYDRTHLIPQLIAAGANPNKPEGAIEAAVACNNKDAMIYLLEQGVDPNVRNPSGQTALTTAIAGNNIELIGILLARGARPDVRGRDWPVSVAVKSPNILAKLLTHMPTSKIPKGTLESAVAANEIDAVRLLVAKGVDVEDKTSGVFSPLTTAIREDRKEIFRYLLDEAGADPNEPGEHLPLIKAIRRHREDDLSYVEHLLQKGADINLMHRGWNAVLQALDKGDTSTLRMLAAFGSADLDARDENGSSVREILQERQLEEEEQILLGKRGLGKDSVLGETLLSLQGLGLGLKQGA